MIVLYASRFRNGEIDLKTKKSGQKIKEPIGERVFNIFNNVFMFLIMIIMVYPMWYVLVASFSESQKMVGFEGIMWLPRGLSLDSYRLMVKNPMVLRGYLNTIYIVVVSVSLNIIFTAIGAYFLSRKNVMWQKYVMIMVTLTMFFSGGMIPDYLTFTKIYHLRNSYWVLILPGLINTFNLIVMRTSFASIPDSLCESATIDGAGHWRVLFSIVLPLSKAVMAVIILYYAVAHWNEWFNASIYLSDRTKYPLQLILREILISNDTTSMTAGNVDARANKESVAETIKYATIVVATVPILCVYPFLQKYFTKGTLIGAVKE